MPHAARAHAATLVDLDLLGARDDVARGELHLVGSRLLHEAFALGVEQVGALAARALGDEDAGLDEACGVVLDHLHVHQRGAQAVGHGDAVAGDDQAVGGGLVDLAGAAAGEDHVLGLKGLHPPAAHVARDRPRAAALLVLEQRGREPLLVAVDGLVVLHQLLIEHVQHRLAGDVGDVGGALHRGSAERAQVHFAVLVAVEGDADVLQVHDLGGRLRAHDFDRVLVAQEVRALDRVVGVGAPVVVDAIAALMPPAAATECERTGWTLLMIATLAPSRGGRQGGALAGETGPDDQDVVCWHGWMVLLRGGEREALRGDSI